MVKYLSLNHTHIIQIPSVQSFYLFVSAQLQDYEQAELNRLKEEYEYDYNQSIEDTPVAFATFVIDYSQRAQSQLPRLAWCSAPTLLGHHGIWFSFKIKCTKPKIDMINYMMNLIGKDYVIERDYNLIYLDKCVQLDIINVEMLSDIQIVTNLWPIIERIN